MYLNLITFSKIMVHILYYNPKMSLKKNAFLSMQILLCHKKVAKPMKCPLYESPIYESLINEMSYHTNFFFYKMFHL